MPGAPHYQQALPAGHQAFIGAPFQPTGAGYGALPALPPLGGYGPPVLAPPYGGLPPPPVPVPWDPTLLAAQHYAPSPSSSVGGGDSYMNSGATTHMAAHPGNLTSSTPVHTPTRITVGNGSSLPITHIGSTSFPSTSTPITMSNVLVSPDLVTNLVSVRRLLVRTHLLLNLTVLAFL